MAREQRKSLAIVDSELAELRRRLDWLYNLVETTDLDMADITSRIKEHREQGERLEESAEEARAVISRRRYWKCPADTSATTPKWSDSFFPP